MTVPLLVQVKQDEDDRHVIERAPLKGFLSEVVSDILVGETTLEERVDIVHSLLV